MAVSVRSLDRSSFEAFVAFNPDAAERGQKALAVLGHGDKRRLEIVSVANIWERFKHRHHVSDTDINHFLHSRLYVEEKNEEKTGWLDHTNRDLKHRYAQRDKQISSFKNPLPDHLLIRISIPYVTSKSTLDKPRFEKKEIKLDYDELTDIEDLQDIFREALKVLHTKSNGCSWKLSRENFTLSEKIQALYDNLFDEKGTIADFLSDHDDLINDEAVLKIKPIFNQAVLKKNLMREGGQEGKEAGIKQARKSKKTFTPTIDEDEIRSDCFGLDEWYNAHKKEGKRAFTNETVLLKELEEQRAREKKRRAAAVARRPVSRSSNTRKSPARRTGGGAYGGGYYDDISNPSHPLSYANAVHDISYSYDGGGGGFGGGDGGGSFGGGGCDF